MDHSSDLKELFRLAEGSPGPSDGPEGGGTPSEDRAGDDKKRLEELFGRPSAPSRPQGTIARSHEDEGPWPGHNYNEAYHQITRHRPRPRRSQSADESTLWEINDLLDDRSEIRPPTPSAPVPPTPWPEQRAMDLTAIQHASDGSPAQPSPEHQDPGRWLAALDEEPVLPTTTEARLIGTLRGDADTMRRTLFDTTQTLHAHEPAPPAQTDAPTSTTRSRTRQTLPARPRALVMKLAGAVIGLKLGIGAGYLLATLL